MSKRSWTVDGLSGLVVLVLSASVASCSRSNRSEPEKPDPGTAQDAKAGAPVSSALELVPGAGGASCPTGMALIPGGRYKPGAREDAAIPTFCLDVMETTVRAYTACVEARACGEPNPYKPYTQRANDYDQFCNWKNPGRETHPVNCIDYGQASAYCAFANKRLPSDQEWEWAARNGDRATTYPWGNEQPSPDRLNACGTECASVIRAKINVIWNPMYTADDRWPDTAPVGAFPGGANRWGVMDLAGNVAEWTSTADAATRVNRGGSWISDSADLVRADMRILRTPSDRTSYLGVRCAKNVP